MQLTSVDKIAEDTLKLRERTTISLQGITGLRDHVAISLSIEKVALVLGSGPSAPIEPGTYGPPGFREQKNPLCSKKGRGN
jgi:hypothetical protein